MLMPIWAEDGDFTIPAFLNAVPDAPSVVADKPETVSDTVTPELETAMDDAPIASDDGSDIAVEASAIETIAPTPPVAPSFKVPSRVMSTSNLAWVREIPPVAPSCVLKIAA